MIEVWYWRGRRPCLSAEEYQEFVNKRVWFPASVIRFCGDYDIFYYLVDVAYGR